MADEIREGEPEKPKKAAASNDEERPRKPRRADAEEPEAGGSDLGSSPLAAVVPVGGSIWALLSLYLALLGCAIPGLPFLALLFGIVALIMHKSKASYGSITGNMRAVLGILISLVGIVFHAIMLFMFLSNPRMFG